MDGHAVSDIYFGLNPMWVSTCVLVVTYAVIITEKINRSIVALIGAALMVVVGVLDQEEAIAGRRLEHDRASDRHDDPGLDLAPFGHVPIPRDLVGAGGARASGRYPGDAARSPRRCSPPFSTM